jgi:hypothetical protein
MPKTDPRVDKRRVTMTSYTTTVGENGEPITLEHKAVDYVRPDHLDAYVANARENWQHVAVSEEPDAGPGGYDGQTAVPAGLDVPDAGVVYPANQEG